MPSCKYIVNFSIADWQAKWLVFAILLTANYGTDTANGGYSISNYIIFVILCWLPFVCGDILLKRNETRKMTSSIEETLRLIQLTLEKVMQTCENVEKCTLIIYLAAHIYIVAVLHSLFISHILVFLVLIIQHIVPKIYTLGAKCSFYGVKYMMAVKKRESIKYFPFQNLIYRLLN